MIDIFDTPQPIHLFRSTLERYTVCPFQAKAIEDERVLVENDAMRSGQEAHEIIAGAVADYARDGIPPKDTLEQEKYKGRADVNADVIDALRRSCWSISNLLTDHNPADVMLYDGGEGEQSGQIAVEILPATADRGKVLASSEIDLLLASPSVEEVHEIDWKTGRQVWAATDVLNSFQFRMHAWLIFSIFPDVNRVVTRVFMTRLNDMTPPVVFKRERMADYRAMIDAAVKEWLKAQDGEPECWPRPEKCAGCEAIHLCPIADDNMDERVLLEAELNVNPVNFAATTQTMLESVNRRLVLQRVYVDAHGDIIGDGVAFGLGAPKKASKPKANEYKTYNIKENNDDRDD